MATRKQKAAARRNIRKAQAANRRRNGCKYGKKVGKPRCRKARRTARQLAAARRNIRKAIAANRRRGHGRRKRRGGKKKSKRRSRGYFAQRAAVLGEFEGPVSAINPANRGTYV